MYNCSYILGNYINKEFYVSAGIILLGLFSAVFYKSISKTKANYAAFFLVIAGGALNLYERVFRGCVSDNLSFFGHVFFNMNDLLVVLGLFKILFSLYYKPADKIVAE